MSCSIYRTSLQSQDARNILLSLHSKPNVKVRYEHSVFEQWSDFRSMIFSLSLHLVTDKKSNKHLVAG